MKVGKIGKRLRKVQEEMATGIQLVLLRCPNCNSSLGGEKAGVFLYCGECGSGFEVMPEAQLSPIRVSFARTEPDATAYFPFWVFNARLELKHREAQKSPVGSSKGLIRLFEQRETIRLYVPAYFTDLESKDSRGLQLTYDQPDLDPTPRQPQVQGFVISQEDARKIADYLFITSEAEQSDLLRNLEYRLELYAPSILVIAF